MIKYPDISRIDFADYLSTYSDLQEAFGNNINAAKTHWINNGRMEGRHIRLKDINYSKLTRYVIDNHHVTTSAPIVNILTSLYKDSDPFRAEEYRLALQLNLKNPHVEKVHVLWDGEECDMELDVDNQEKLTITPHEGRPSFETLFNYCNDHPGKLWCVCNGDIVLTKDIYKLQSVDMSRNLLALTRWEFVSETDISIFHENEQPNKYSQDTWCFQSPILTPSELQLVYMGKVACDSEISNVYKHYEYPIYNPSIDIKTLHMHMQNKRTQEYNIANAGYVDYCSLNNI